MTTPPPIRVWDAPTRLFHWIMVGLLGFSWWSAEMHEMEWHQLSGLTLAGLVIFRLLWGVMGSSTARFANFLRGPATVWRYVRHGAPAGIGHNPLGAWSVVGLLLVLTIQIASGLFSVDVDGIESGPLSYLLDFDQGRLASSIHDSAFAILQLLVALHVLAIFYYLIVRKRDLITPMVSGKQASIATDAKPLIVAPLWKLAFAIIVAGSFAYALARGFQF